MSSQPRGGYESESVIPFAPAAKNQAPPESADQLDKAGQTILRLLQKAAGVAEANSKHALDMAQKLSHQLRAAEDRIAELEAEVGIYQDKADRAEAVATQGLHGDRGPISAAGRRPPRRDWSLATDARHKDFALSTL
jgi:hypothetical protein